MNRALEGEAHIFSTDPDYPAYRVLSHDAEQEDALTFEQFHQFISLEALDSKTSTSFLNFLQELFEKTPNRLWFLGSCCGAVEIARCARIISSHYFPEQTKINVLMEQNHLWSIVKRPNQTEVIVVDPAGICDPELETVLPYFGVLEACSFEGYPLTYAKQVYTQGEILTPDQEKILLRYQEILLRDL